MTKKQWIADGLLLAAAIIWGSAFAVVKNTLDSVPPSMMIALRFGIAALISGVILRKHLRGLTRGQVLMGLLVGVLTGLAYIVQTIGLQDTTAGKNAFLTTIYVLLVPFGSAVLFHEKLSKRRYVAAVLMLLGIGILSLDGSRYYAVCGAVGPHALRLYTLTSLDMQLRMLLYSGGLFIVLLLLLSGAVVAMTKAFTRQNAMELGELTAAVEDLSKNGGAEALPPQCSEESQALYTRFRELIAHNDELLNRRRQMEIKHLEEQFNPHFVYNVMETVRYQISEDPETASEMLLSFASLMRYSVNYGHTKVLLETDVEYVNDYLLLQKARYNNCLLYDFDIPEELLECRVPKLLLQPVIENSIVHGYRAGRTLSIRVQAEHRDDTLRFIVTDDGAGIPAGRLAELRESFEHDLTNEYAAHVGLYNIQKVIRLTYGAPYGVQIESAEGQGTAVTLTIPYEVEENEGC